MLSVPVLVLVILKKFRLIYLNLCRNWFRYFYLRNYVEKMEPILKIKPTKTKIGKENFIGRPY